MNFVPFGPNSTGSTSNRDQGKILWNMQFELI